MKGTQDVNTEVSMVKLQENKERRKERKEEKLKKKKKLWSKENTNRERKERIR